jgi:8-oxo-dGTP pyrophosphatase MutT (NUDIX family)
MADVPGLLREISYLKGSAPSLYIHCHAGFGRTGTVLHLHYLHRGMMLRDVQQRVAATRPGCTHLTDAQLQFLGRYQQGLLLRDQPVPPSAPVVQQAAALPLRHGPNGLETLLITSSAGDCWLIPKGHIEADETAPETARKEAEEEAGVRGRLSPASIGEFSYTKYGIRYRAEAFALHVTEILREWDECSIRSRQWVGLAEAADVVALPTLSELLKSLPSRLAEPPAPPNSTE